MEESSSTIEEQESSQNIPSFIIQQQLLQQQQVQPPQQFPNDPKKYSTKEIFDYTLMQIWSLVRDITETINTVTPTNPNVKDPLWFRYNVSNYNLDHVFSTLFTNKILNATELYRYTRGGWTSAQYPNKMTLVEIQTEINRQINNEKTEIKRDPHSIASIGTTGSGGSGGGIYDIDQLTILQKQQNPVSITGIGEKYLPREPIEAFDLQMNIIEKNLNNLKKRYHLSYDNNYKIKTRFIQAPIQTPTNNAFNVDEDDYDSTKLPLNASAYIEPRYWPLEFHHERRVRFLMLLRKNILAIYFKFVSNYIIGKLPGDDIAGNVNGVIALQEKLDKSIDNIKLLYSADLDNSNMIKNIIVPLTTEEYEAIVYEYISNMINMKSSINQQQKPEDPMIKSRIMLLQRLILAFANDRSLRIIQTFRLDAPFQNNYGQHKFIHEVTEGIVALIVERLNELRGGDGDNDAIILLQNDSDLFNGLDFFSNTYLQHQIALNETYEKTMNEIERIPVENTRAKRRLASKYEKARLFLELEMKDVLMNSTFGQFMTHHTMSDAETKDFTENVIQNNNLNMTIFYVQLENLQFTKEYLYQKLRKYKEIGWKERDIHKVINVDNNRNASSNNDIASLSSNQRKKITLSVDIKVNDTGVNPNYTLTWYHNGKALNPKSKSDYEFESSSSLYRTTNRNSVTDNTIVSSIRYNDNKYNNQKKNDVFFAQNDTSIDEVDYDISTLMNNIVENQLIKTNDDDDNIMKELDQYSTSETKDSSNTKIIHASLSLYSDQLAGEYYCVVTGQTSYGKPFNVTSDAKYIISMVHTCKRCNAIYDSGRNDYELSHAVLNNTSADDVIGDCSWKLNVGNYLSNRNTYRFNQSKQFTFQYLFNSLSSLYKKEKEEEYTRLEDDPTRNLFVDISHLKPKQQQQHVITIEDIKNEPYINVLNTLSTVVDRQLNNLKHIIRKIKGYNNSYNNNGNMISDTFDGFNNGQTHIFEHYRFLIDSFIAKYKKYYQKVVAKSYPGYLLDEENNDLLKSSHLTSTSTSSDNNNNKNTVSYQSVDNLIFNELTLNDIESFEKVNVAENINKFYTRLETKIESMVSNEEYEPFERLHYLCENMMINYKQKKSSSSFIGVVESDEDSLFYDKNAYDTIQMEYSTRNSKKIISNNSIHNIGRSLESQFRGKHNSITVLPDRYCLKMYNDNMNHMIIVNRQFLDNVIPSTDDGKLRFELEFGSVIADWASEIYTAKKKLVYLMSRTVKKIYELDSKKPYNSDKFLLEQDIPIYNEILSVIEVLNNLITNGNLVKFM